MFKVLSGSPEAITSFKLLLNRLAGVARVNSVDQHVRRKSCQPLALVLFKTKFKYINNVSWTIAVFFCCSDLLVLLYQLHDLESLFPCTARHHDLFIQCSIRINKSCFVCRLSLQILLKMSRPKSKTKKVRLQTIIL